MRLSLSPIIVHCLRMAIEELKSTVEQTAEVRHRLH